MDPQQPSRLFWILGKVWRALQAGFAVVIAAIVLVTCGPWLAEHSQQAAKSEKKEGIFQYWIDQWKTSVSSVHAKLDELQKADQENQKLHRENAFLKLKIETSKVDCVMQSAAEATRSYSQKLEKKTGSAVGSTLASLRYRAPESYSPAQSFGLGVQSLKANDQEKVAVLFTILTGLEKIDRYKTARNFLITAVAWYSLENYLLSDFYLDRTLEVHDSDHSLPFKAQARLWKALTSKRLKNEKKSQYWLRQLVDHHPRAAESEWINAHKGKGKVHEKH